MPAYVARRIWGTLVDELSSKAVAEKWSKVVEKLASGSV